MIEAKNSLPNFKKLLKEILSTVNIPDNEIKLELGVNNSFEIKNFPKEDFDGCLNKSKGFIEKSFEKEENKLNNLNFSVKKKKKIIFNNNILK
jgi:hypothetical protein